MKQRLFHIQALSALHVGTGQSVGVVDLPIARARATHLPIVPGSAIKGVLRDDMDSISDAMRTTLFGPKELANGDAFAGALAVGDAHLLILPVRSFAGIAAFATCNFILRRYARDLSDAPALPSLSANEAVLPEGSQLVLGQKGAKKIVLEDLDLKAAEDEINATAWADAIASALYPEGAASAQDWREEFKKHFVILPDAEFSFLADSATEIRARVRIDDRTRTVMDGALWYEENLPAESVLWGVMGVSRARDASGQSEEMLSDAMPAGEQCLQIGGKHTVGRGMCRFLLA